MFIFVPPLVQLLCMSCMLTIPTRCSFSDSSTSLPSTRRSDGHFTLMKGRPFAANNNNSPHTSEIQDTDKTRACSAASAIIKSSDMAVAPQSRGQTGGEPHVGREWIPFVLPPTTELKNGFSRLCFSMCKCWVLDVWVTMIVFKGWITHVLSGSTPSRGLTF